MNDYIYGLDVKKTLVTKFGRANLDSHGYYRITSRKENNYNKLLHRLIFEDYHNLSLLDSVVIHHIDGNKLNNSLENLEMMYYGDHARLHNTGNSYWLGKKHSERTKQKMALAHKGKIHSESHRINSGNGVSRANTSTGIKRVYKIKCDDYVQGFFWRYEPHESTGLKKFSSKDIHKLKEKALDRGLEWEIVDEDKAKVSMECLCL